MSSVDIHLFVLRPCPNLLKGVWASCNALLSFLLFTPFSYGPFCRSHFVILFFSLSWALIFLLICSIFNFGTYLRNAVGVFTCSIWFAFSTISAFCCCLSLVAYWLQCYCWNGIGQHFGPLDAVCLVLLVPYALPAPFEQSQLSRRLLDMSRVRQHDCLPSYPSHRSLGLALHESSGLFWSLVTSHPTRG